MPKAQIFHFSATGNTWAIAMLYKELLESKGWKASVTAIDKLRGAEIELDVDLLLIGYPIHAWNLPQLVRDFVEELPAKEGLKVAGFVTMGGDSHGALPITWRLLADKGYSVVGIAEYVMPSNYVIGGHVGTVEEFKEKKETAVLQCRQAVDDILSGKVQNMEFPESEIEYSETWYKRMAQAFPKAPRRFIVGEDCTLCELCVDLCPYQNITIAENKIVYGEECILCLRCINICPVGAINYRDQTQNLGRYIAPGFGKAALS